MDRFHIDLIAAIFVYKTMRKRWPYWCTKKSPLGIELFSFVKPSFAQKKKIIAVDHVCENDLLKPYKMYKCFFSLNDLETHFPFSFGCKCFREQSLIDHLSSANQNISFSGRDLSQKKMYACLFCSLFHWHIVKDIGITISECICGVHLASMEPEVRSCTYHLQYKPLVNLWRMFCLI